MRHHDTRKQRSVNRSTMRRGHTGITSARVRLCVGALLVVMATLPVVGQGPSKDDKGHDDTRRDDVDFDKDGEKDFCRVIGGGSSPFYLACDLQGEDGVTFKYWPVSDPGHRYARRFVDWDGDGFLDYCRVVGNDGGAKNMRCNFGNGRRFGGDYDSSPFDAGYHDSNVTFEESSSGATFCADAGSSHEMRTCLPSKKRGFGTPSLTKKQ
jgi:hypothetical protein